MLLKPRFFDPQTPPHILTLTLIAGLAALTLNVFLPSLPVMAEAFGTDYAAMQLTVSAYLTMTAIAQLLIGPISDRFGRRPVMLAVLAIFTAASLGAALSTSYEVFFACRLLQAVIASTFALTRAVVRDMVPPNEAASMIGYITMGMSLVPMLGPAIGGALQKSFGWQASLWLLVIGGALVLLMSWRDLGETSHDRMGSFSAQFRAYPALLRSGAFWAYCLASTFASGSFYAFLGGIPFVGSKVYHLSATLSGLGFAAPAIGYLVGNYLSGRYTARLGIQRMVLFGAWVATLSLGALFVLTLVTPIAPLLFFAFIVPMGLGNGMLLPSANSGLLSVRPELAGSAAGLGTAITIAGGAGLSFLTGQWLTEASGAELLAFMMSASALLSILTAYWILRLPRPHE